MKLKKIDSEIYNRNPDCYELVSGSTKGAPLCPFGNQYKWIGYDHNQEEFVRFTKSVFKKLVHAKN